ncbi:Fic family protein [Candidatus Micrarchaeota archaeon]|nr:Fic family protein [Candidatus Micrarchaeota archaeon]
MVDYALRNSDFNGKAGQIEINSKGQPTFLPAALPEKLDYDEKTVICLDRADRKLSELSGIGRVLPNPHLLIRPYMAKESVDSSRIEGTHSGLSEVLSAEAGEEPAADSDVAEVINHVRALEYGMSKVKSEGFTLDLIREMHRILLQNVRGHSANRGSFRTIQNFIGPTNRIEDAEFIPAAPEKVSELMSDFEKYANTQHNVPLLIKAGLLHYQFETIHPFLDGNGRIGRALISIFLVKNDCLSQPLLYLSPYLKKFQPEYYERLMHSRQTGDHAKWLEFFLTAVAVQSEDALTRSKRILDLRQQYFRLLEEKKSNAITYRVLDEFFERLYCSMPGLSRETGHHFQTVQRHVKELEKLGIVQETTSRKRNKIYVAKEILEIVK